MKNIYNVIWIDDEWDKMDEFKLLCEEVHHIHLEPFRTQKAGMEELDKHLESWDAVILDAKMFDESEYETPMLTGLSNAINHINQLSLRKRIPYFISTGQPDLVDDEKFTQIYKEFYIKGKDDLRLIEDLKREVDNFPRHQVQLFYNDAIENLREINQSACETIIDIFEAMHYPSSHPNFKPILYYNQLRQILEYVYRAANKVAIIPDECISNSGEVNLSQCCHYLSGNNATVLKIRYGEKGDRVIPKHIQDMMVHILTLGNINSHTSKLSEEDERNLAIYINENVYNSRYLIYSLALQLCEVVMWMNCYIANHPNKEENQKKCVKLESIEECNKEISEDDKIGIVEYDGTSYHLGDKFLLKRSLIENKGWQSKKIKVVEYIKNKEIDASKYKFYAKYIEPV